MRNQRDVFLIRCKFIEMCEMDSVAEASAWLHTRGLSHEDHFSKILIKMDRPLLRVAGGIALGTPSGHDGLPVTLSYQDASMRTQIAAVFIRLKPLSLIDCNSSRNLRSDECMCVARDSTQSSRVSR